MAKKWKRAAWYVWKTMLAVMAVVALLEMGRSFYVTDDFRICRHQCVFHVRSSGGFWQIEYVSGIRAPRGNGVWLLSTHVPSGMLADCWNETFFGLRHERSAEGIDYEIAGFRWWVVASRESWSGEAQLPEWAVVGGLATVAWWGVRRRRVGQAGARLCTKCGYDTRGNVGRCSECGAGIR